jgi:hypothetical protein
MGFGTLQPILELAWINDTKLASSICALCDFVGADVNNYLIDPLRDQWHVSHHFPFPSLKKHQPI